MYNCSLPGLGNFAPGLYEGETVNYLSFVTGTSSPNLPVRAKEFEACTGGRIAFSEATNVWEDPIQDLGTKTSRGSEIYDGYFMSYSHFPEASALGLAEHLNSRIRDSNEILKWEDIFPKVRVMGQYRKDGKTNIDFLMYDGDFFVPIIRLDLLEKKNLALPNSWEEVVEYAKLFNGTDLNDDGDPNDFGFCHFPRRGAGYWDWMWAEALYSTWATSDQTTGINQGFFFDEETMEPLLGDGFRRAAETWKDLWINGNEGCITSNFFEGRCAIGFAPPGCWKGIFLNPDGVSRKDENGTVIWRPTMKSGEYAEPYRFKPFGSTHVVDRSTGKLTQCTPELCPKAELVPPKGHHGNDDRASVLPESPIAGQLINRAPFYWSGGLGTLIRKSSTEVKKDLMWDFFAYTNSPETSVYDVANYASWLDSWRYSQLLPAGKNFLDAGWSEQSYKEHSSVMQWALSNDVNGALNLRMPGLMKYTRDIMGDRMLAYIQNSISLDSLVTEVKAGWIDVTLGQGKLEQLEIYRSALGLDSLPDVRLCNLHRRFMDKRDPSICRQFDTAGTRMLIPALVAPSLIAIIAVILFFHLDRKRRAADYVWKINPTDLTFSDPLEILGRGTFGLVLLAEYRGTPVAVKRVIPPKETVEEKKPLHEQVERRKSELFDMESGFLNSANLASFNNSGFGGSGMDKVFGSASISFQSQSLGQGSTQTESTKKPRSSFGWFGSKGTYHKLKADFVKEMRYLSKLRHPCITTVMGAVTTKNEDPMLIMEYMDHGSLYDIIHNESIPLDGDLILPILRDIAQGLRFLHAANPQVIHGDLKAHNVLVDNRFRAKVADFGLSAKKSVGATGTPLWMAPELLRGESTNTSKSDVYSFGIILYEIYSRKDPYEGDNPRTILRDIAHPDINKRPPIPEACPHIIENLMTDCVGADPELRPDFVEIDMRLKRLDTETVEPGESQTSMRHKKAQRNDDLLNKVFPKHIAEALRDGRPVEPERKEITTVYFSDIVGFTTLASLMTPEKVADMVERLYAKFDELSIKHDVFQIDTIGDAYMCVTNLVKDQKNDHVKRMAEFAIEAVKAAGETLVDTDEPSMGYVKIRAGFHCGPVIARVVGSRTPKYSIFGDTVNTASRMESNSRPGKVHCSERAADLLKKQSPWLRLRSRGISNVKGKGEMETFFVKGPPGMLHAVREASQSSSLNESQTNMETPTPALTLAPGPAPGPGPAPENSTEESQFEIVEPSQAIFSNIQDDSDWSQDSFEDDPQVYVVNE